MKPLTLTNWESFSSFTRLSIVFANDGLSHSYMTLILRILSYLQIIAALFENTPIYHGKAIRSPAFDAIFRYVKDIMSLDYFTTWLDLKSAVIALLVILAIYFGFFSIVLIKTYFKIQKEFVTSPLIKFCSKIMTIHSELLIYPISFLLLKLLSTMKLSLLDLDTPVKEVFVILSIIFLCFNGLFAYYKTMFCYSHVNLKNITSRNGHLHLTGMITLKILTPIFQFLGDTDEDQNRVYFVIDAVFCFAVCLSIFLFTRYKTPEYNPTLMKSQIIFDSIFLGISIGKLINLIAKDSQPVFIPTFFVLPFWIKLNLNYSKAQDIKLKHLSGKLPNITDICHLEIVYKNLEAGLAFNLASERFPTSAIEAKWLFHNNFWDSSSWTTSEENELDYLKKNSKLFFQSQMEAFCNRNPKNVLGLLTYAQLLSKDFNRHAKAYDLCLKALKQGCSTSDIVSIFIIWSQIQQVFHPHEDKHDSKTIYSNAMINYCTAEEYFLTLISQMNNYISHATSFWQLTQAETPNIHNLLTKADELETEKRSIQTYWKKHELSFFQNLPMGFMLYGVFEAHFLDNPSKGSQKIKKYSQLIRNKLFFQAATSDDKAEYGIISISGQKDTLGKVLSSSEVASKMFNVDKDALIGQNVNLIMPRYFQEKHDHFLGNFYETGKANILNKEVKFYGKNREEHIFPITLNVTIQPSFEQGIAYTALIRKIEDQTEYILYNENGEIEETSQAIGEILDLKQTRRVHINQVLAIYAPDLIVKSPNNEIDEGLLEEDESMKSQTITLKRKKSNSNIEKTIKYQIEMSSYSYLNKKLNVLILKPKGYKVRKSERNLVSKKTFANIDAMTRKNISESNKQAIETINESESPVKSTKRTLQTTERFQTDRKLLKGVTTSDESFNAIEGEMGFESLTSHEIERTRFSIGKKASSISSTSSNSLIDDFQEMYKESRPSRMKKIIITVFVMVILTCITVTGIQNFILRESLDNINFTINIVKASYDRLNALGWIWRYSVIYKTRVDGIIPTNAADLSRYRTLLQTNRLLIKQANDALAMAVTIGRKDQQQVFFDQNIKFTYVNMSANLQTRYVNTFEAINTFVERLIIFNNTPDAVTFTNGNPDLEFVRVNAINDLLVECEYLIQVVEDDFENSLSNNAFIMRFIYVLNIIIGMLLIILLVINLYMQYRRATKIFGAFLSIDSQDVTMIIGKLSSFNQILSKQRKYLSYALHKFHLKQDLEIPRIKPSRSLGRDYNMKGLVLNKLKQNLFSVLLVCGISLMCSIEYISYNVQFNDLLRIHSRIIFTEKGRYHANLAYANLYDVVGSLNTTFVRNQPSGNQLLVNLNDVVLSSTLLDEYTGADGHIIDPKIEQLFKGQPCSLVVNFPGSLNPVNCPKSTLNNAIGFLAINSIFLEEMVWAGGQILANLTYDRAREVLPTMVNLTNIKLTTIIGAYMFLLDTMNDKYDAQRSSLISQSKDFLVLELVLMIVMSFICVWHLVKKVLDDSFIPVLLRVIPFDQVIRNKILQNVIKKVYHGRARLLHMNHHMRA